MVWIQTSPAQMTECAGCYAEVDSLAVSGVNVKCGKPICHWWFGKNSVTQKAWLLGFCDEHRLWGVTSNPTGAGEYDRWHWKQISYEEAVARSVMEA